MAYRSENDFITNKLYYKDLNLTQYPGALDTRDNNKNMRGFINIGEGSIPDYVMAEYVNATLDGVMAIERALGANPMVPVGTLTQDLPNVIETKTVADRLDSLENKNFDERYGGATWTYVPGRATLSNHNHDGLNGHPGKISLTTEIEGKLLKGNVELSVSTGLLGSDIYVSSANPIKIDKAISDALSKTQGGTVTGSTDFKGHFSSRTRMDYVATELTKLDSATLVSDSEATTGQAVQQSTSTSAKRLCAITSTEKSHLLYGKYVLVLRVKTSLTGASSVLRVQAGDATQLYTADEVGTTYRQIHVVFEHNAANKANGIIIEKLATAGTASVSVDNVFIEPIHPAVFDR